MIPAIEGGEPVRKNLLVFGEPQIGEEEIGEVVNTLRSGWIGTGPKTAKFEKMMQDYLGTDYTLALSSCTAALHLSMVASDLGPGDEVITTPMTFCATANAIVHTGAKPVFVDIDTKTLNIDPKNIEQAITPRTKAIIPVHFAGRPCDMDEIIKIAKKNNLLIIEDAAHAIGAEYKGKKIGAIGDFTCFSFYVTKNITTAEGGMIATNNSFLADRIKKLGLHGMSKDAWKRFSDEGYKHYYVEEAGFKYNMTDIQASLGIHQLARLSTIQKKREEIWKKYDTAFKNLPLSIPEEVGEEIKHSRHLYTLILDTNKLKINRDEFLDALQKEGIGTGVHYTALHLHPFYMKRFGYKKGDFPNTEYIGERTISIPLSSKLSDQDVNDVINAVIKIAEYYKK